MKEAGDDKNEKNKGYLKSNNAWKVRKERQRYRDIDTLKDTWK